MVLSIGLAMTVIDSYLHAFPRSPRGRNHPKKRSPNARDPQPPAGGPDGPLPDRTRDRRRRHGDRSTWPRTSGTTGGSRSSCCGPSSPRSSAPSASWLRSSSPPTSSTRTSSRSSTRARPTASCSTSCPSSKGNRSGAGSPGRSSSPCLTRSGSPPRSPRRSTTPTATAWCTATSSPRTSCCTMAARWWPTSASPSRRARRAATG